MDDPTVYSDSEQPGAPRVGDVVVVVLPEPHAEHYPDPLSIAAGDIGRISAWDTSSIPWRVDVPMKGTAAGAPGAARWAQKIRRPTEAELAAWALQEHGGDQ